VLRDIIPVHEAQQIALDLLRIEPRTEILHAHLAIAVNERGELRMLDRAVVLL